MKMMSIFTHSFVSKPAVISLWNTNGEFLGREEKTTIRVLLYFPIQNNTNAYCRTVSNMQETYLQSYSTVKSFRHLCKNAVK